MVFSDLFYLNPFPIRGMRTDLKKRLPRRLDDIETPRNDKGGGKNVRQITP